MNAPASELDPKATDVAGVEAPPAPAPDAPDEVPAAPVDPPGAAEELIAFVRALGRSAHAELSLSYAATVRAIVLGAIALIAVAFAWATAMVALTLALTAWIGVIWTFALLAVAHGIVAAVAWTRRMRWQRRIGFPRTRAAIATLAGGRESPP